MRYHEGRLIRLGFGVICTAAGLLASTQVVGIATSEGSFRVNGRDALRNANLAAGVSVETQGATANLSLNQGGRVMLASESKARVLNGAISLEAGKCRISSGASLPLQAFDFRVAPAPGTEAVVAVNGPKSISVTALKGQVRVLNGAGALLANVMPGAGLSFADVGEHKGDSRISGVLKYENGRFLLNDEATNVRYEVRGGLASSHAGQRVEASGQIEAQGNTPVLMASAVRLTQGNAFHTAMQIGQAPGMGSHLIITVLDGEGALNNVTSRVAREPVVQVEDENHKKVEGAYVKFTLPATGPGAVGTAGNVITVVTDASGIARLKGLKTNKDAGPWEILVEVAFQGSTAQTVIHQSNTTAVATGAGASGAVIAANTKALIIGVAVAAGLAGTATGFAASAGNGVSSNSP